MAKNPVPKSESQEIEKPESVTEVMPSKGVRTDANNDPNAVNPNSALSREDKVMPEVSSAKEPVKTIGGGTRKDN